MSGPSKSKKTKEKVRGIGIQKNNLIFIGIFIGITLSIGGLLILSVDFMVGLILFALSSIVTLSLNRYLLFQPEVSNRVLLNLLTGILVIGCSNFILWFYYPTIESLFVDSPIIY